MKRANLFFGIAILTFGIGVIIVWLSGSFSNLLTVSNEAIRTENDQLGVDIPLKSDKPIGEQVQIKFLSAEKRDAPRYVFVRFQVVNNSPETLYYTGYDKSWNCSYTMKRNKKLENKKLVCSCGVGLKEQSLLPYETTTYDVAVLPQSRKDLIQVGYDFEVGQERRKETVWSEEAVVKK